jgi:two-component system cell cycle response regulator
MIVALNIFGTKFIMKPLKKTVQPFPGIKRATTINDYFPPAIKKTTGGNGNTLPKKGQGEILLVPTEDIPPEECINLLSSKRGIIVHPQENLLQRLLKLEKENQHLKSLSLTDELTGLNNKRFFNRQMKIEITRTKRTGQPFCLIFIDLDNFKSVNDTLGHSKGDEFLVKLCRLICQKIRPTDFACRYGGDEFTMILPATSLLDGISIAQRWHELIEQMAADMNLKVSSSIGIDEYNSYSTMSAEEFINKVDQTLYIAKRTGKGKVAHPEITVTDSMAVTSAEKETLYNFFVPLTGKSKRTQTVRRKK